MKIKFLMQIGLALVIAFFVSSCLDEDDDADIQTKAEEMVLLNKYLANLEGQGYDIDTTDLNVYYITIEEGEGDYPEFGDTLTVVYSGYFVYGFLFDASNIHE